MIVGYFKGHIWGLFFPFLSPFTFLLFVVFETLFIWPPCP